MAETENKTGKSGGENDPTLEGRKPTAPVEKLDSGESALASVPLFGGNRGGRARDDGLKAGTAEAKEADKLYDRVSKFIRNNPGKKHPEESKVPANILARYRKFAMRESAAKAGTLANPVPRDPAPLPSIVETPRVADSAPTPTDSVVSEPAGDVAALTSWDAKEIAELSGDILLMVEDGDTAGIKSKLKKINCPPALQDEVMAMAGWPPSARMILRKYMPRVLGKYLGKMGISAEHAELGAVLTSMLVIGGSRLLLYKRIGELGKKTDAPTPTKTPTATSPENAAHFSSTENPSAADVAKKLSA